MTGKYLWKLGFAVLFAAVLSTGCSKGEGDEIVLRVANSEEYMDEGGWGSDETIQLEDGTEIKSDNSMIQEFEKWYEQTYGTKVTVEYSTYGTNEELYNQMTLGAEFDLVCPSEYMLMKLMQEKKLQAFSQEFWDTSKADNYYTRGVSRYIQNKLDGLVIAGERVSTYGAGYMWGTLGIVYNPEYVTEEDRKHWSMLLDEKYAKRVTMKDSIRDSYFVGLGILNEKLLMKKELLQAEDYAEKLSDIMNDTGTETIASVQDILSDMIKNSYSLETDSGKADMVTGKVAANMQWSGDAVYSLNQAEEDGIELGYAVPEECTNLWFDAWCMLKNGIGGDEKKQQAAEAFINFVSRPDNVIRNMYYIGYTSVISGGEDDRIYEYVKYCYGAEGDSDTADYPLGYFFGEDGNAEDKKYILKTSKDQLSRQLYAQYPSEDVIKRSAVMNFFTQSANQKISQMWTNIRCFDWKGLWE